MRYKFEEIVDKYYEDVYRFIFMMIKNKNDADDITQETFLKVRRYLWKFKGNSSVLTWIYRVATNEVKKSFAKNNRKLKIARITNIEENVSYSNLKEAMEKLDRESYEVLFLKYFKNMSEKEIAFIINVPKGTVKSRLFNAKKKLKEMIKSE